VCCDTMRFASCEALAMVNKSIVVQMEGFCRVCRQAGGRVGLNGRGVGRLGGGGANRISRLRVARRMPWRCVDRRPWALSLRRRSISMYTLCPPHGVDRRWSLRSSSAFWMSGLHAALLAVPHRHAAVHSRRQCRESSLTVDPHPLRRRLFARDHGIGRMRRGCRPSATKPAVLRSLITQAVAVARAEAPSTTSCCPRCETRNFGGHAHSA